jgi:ribonuclease Z
MLPRVLLLGIAAAIAIAGWLGTCVLWRYGDAVREIGALEPRRFEAPTLLVLGSGGETENPARLGPALAFGHGEGVVLVDAGRALAECLRSARIPQDQPGTVLLTSLLPENTVGLDDLLATGWRAGRQRPLRLIGPPGTAALAAALEAAHAAPVAALAGELGLAPAGARFEAVEVGDGWSGSEAGVTLEAAALAGGPFPALAWRLEAGGRAVAIGSTGFARERLEELARGAAVLVHGAVLLEAVEAALEAGVPEAPRALRDARLQLPLRDLAALAQRSGVARLVLVRLRPPPLFDLQYERLVGDTFAGTVVVARDGSEITP